MKEYIKQNILHILVLNMKLYIEEILHKILADNISHLVVMEKYVCIDQFYEVIGLIFLRGIFEEEIEKKKNIKKNVFLI